MDALKILSSLLGNNATSSGIGGQFLDQMVGGLMRGGAQPGGNWGGGLGSVLGNMLGGAQSGGAGGLGGLLGGLMGNRAQSGATGGLGDVLGGLMGGAQGGGLGGLLGGLMGGGNRPQSSGVNLGLLGGLAMAAYQMLGKRGETAAQSSLAGLEQMVASGQGVAPAAVTEMQQQALVMIKAMINAAKADGKVDEQEQQNILSKVAGVGAKEAEFLQNELAKPLNLEFLNGIAREMAPDIYLVSLMAINLDTKEEANYMDQLAQTLGLDAQAVNAIHQQMGVAPLYS
ncbi:MAG: DUF533 domain-containing protein [Candidatus Competibacteraceae bacterium]|nr:DUF533 domain-containing protein [Candidatus Competibacteraceae bacterium]MBK7985059.1 DUF533 domain-containing protein [Candidatus Competibacteraceae bacterium]MBK8895862.1 DUF533 domain-containing protein [Candidatus Competibacteraceae bacterium]MBK8962954.1 DUF533 domain-containing protein [Candidatus Competibacteraceae bacterium]MBK9953110.1 DUF533 domain-containing protein [Candidatus Competibacteraceae bacterium]